MLESARRRREAAKLPCGCWINSATVVGEAFHCPCKRVWRPGFIEDVVGPKFGKGDSVRVAPKAGPYRGCFGVVAELGKLDPGIGWWYVVDLTSFGGRSLKQEFDEKELEAAS